MEKLSYRVFSHLYQKYPEFSNETELYAALSIDEGLPPEVQQRAFHEKIAGIDDFSRYVDVKNHLVSERDMDFEYKMNRCGLAEWEKLMRLETETTNVKRRFYMTAALFIFIVLFGGAIIAKLTYGGYFTMLW